jgi:hypothetical protein
MVRPPYSSGKGTLLQPKYHLSMRFFLLALMIALLPLRSWAGDVMALEMAQQQLVATKSGAVHAISTGATALFSSNATPNDRSHCPDHAQANAGGPAATSDSQDTAQDHCNTCTTCQVCHSVAMASEVQWQVARQLPHYVPIPSSTAFTSAAPAPGFKPPIS